LGKMKPSGGGEGRGTDVKRRKKSSTPERKTESKNYGSKPRAQLPVGEGGKGGVRIR